MEFQKKVDSLLKPIEVENQFVKQALKVSSETKSGNGAKKYSTTGNDFVDNFAAASYFKEPRSYEEVARDMQILWDLDPTLCVKLALYFRLVTRKSKIVIKDKVEELDVQRGQGLKNEGIMRMLWLAINQPTTFKVNLPLFIAAGSWKDVIQMLSLDLQYHGWERRKLDWNFLYLTISAGLNNPETTHLVRKYLPTIRTNKNCTTLESQADTLIGRWLARRFSPQLEKESAYKAYRKIKSEGIAHEWQQLISQQLYASLNFDHIAGRALALLVGSKFLENHDLTKKYINWISSKPVAKFTGYVFELFAPYDRNNRHIEDYKKKTINAQFAQLVKTGKENINAKSSLLVVRDTSNSMTATARGCNVSAFCIAKSMALYFSEFLEGYFADTFAEFSNGCKLHKWKGKTPVDRYINDICSAYANTNFQSVIDLFIRLKEEGVEEKDFPSGILCVSDGEFDNCGTNKSTNFQLAIKRLREAEFSEEYVNSFKIILWDIPNGFYGKDNKVKFEDFADAPNFFYMSGYDPSVVAFILGGNKPEIKAPKNAEELFLTAMDQTLLNRVKIVLNNKKKK
jgi:hypothetical protein